MRGLRKIVTAVVVLGLLIASCSAREDVIEVGALYPTKGSQGPGGLDELRGVQLAAEWVNARGGVDGRKIRVRLAEAHKPDHVPEAFAELKRAGVPMIFGSHGSTISLPAADLAERDGIVFFETGAVGELSMRAARGDKVFRFAPTGAVLGREAVAFARDVLLPKLERDPSTLRYAVTFVNDPYGRAVGQGSIDELADAGYRLAGTFPYELSDDFADVVRRIGASKPDVLFVSAYLDDGVALRKETVRQKLPLVTSVGTSSSYCMHEFGQALGKYAVGLFASDKPDGHVLEPDRLRPEAAEALRWARDTYKERFAHDMAAGALTGFAGAWGMFHKVFPKAERLTSDGIADAARRVTVERGALPNGSGLEYGPAGRDDSSDNLRATSVIWEWVEEGTRKVVWPPEFATSPVVPMMPVSA